MNEADYYTKQNLESAIKKYDQIKALIMPDLKNPNKFLGKKAGSIFRHAEEMRSYTQKTLDEITEHTPQINIGGKK